MDGFRRHRRHIGTLAFSIGMQIDAADGIAKKIGPGLRLDLSATPRCTRSRPGTAGAQCGHRGCPGPLHVGSELRARAARARDLESQALKQDTSPKAAPPDPEDSTPVYRVCL